MVAVDNEEITVGRALPVSAAEYARWAGVPESWVESLLSETVAPAGRGDARRLVDPRVLSNAIRQRAHEVEERVPADVTVLCEVSRALARGGEPEQVARLLLRRVLDALDAQRGAIFFHHEDEWLRLVAAEGVHPRRLPESLEGAAVWAVATHQPLTLVDPRRAGAPAGDGGGPCDALAAPFVVGERALGAIVALRGLEHPPFGEDETSLLVVLATELALAIERVRMQHWMNGRLRAAEEQLEAYARDVRKSFAAEKRRSDELAAALDELRMSYRATVKGLAAAIEAKDAYTAGHLNRVSTYATMIFTRLLPDCGVSSDLEFGFLLHDIGKLGVPDAVLLKQGPLNEREQELMRRHTEIGRRILEEIPFLAGATDLVLYHHERWDGCGYPHGLAGEKIPLEARVFAVADAFDAMTTRRPYRQAISVGAALRELQRGSGTQFWPVAVDAFLSIPSRELEAVTMDAPVL